MVISDTELKQVVYAYKCNKSTLQVKGKINSITIGKRKETGRKCGLKLQNKKDFSRLVCCKLHLYSYFSPLLSDNCKKMGLVFDDVVGIVEVINCKDVKIQVRKRKHEEGALLFPSAFQSKNQTRVMSLICVLVSRLLERSPPSPSTRQTAATFT